MFRLGRPRRALIVSVLALLAGMGVVQDAGAAGLTWNKPVATGQAPFAQYSTVRGLSCPTTSLCVGVSDLGAVVRSTNPTAAAPTWARENIERTSVCNGGVNAYCPAGFYAVSCPSTSLCVAVDGVGDAFVSTNPAAANPTWARSNIEDSTFVVAISCLSASLCVAVDGSGRALVSHNPTASAPDWAIAFIDTHALSAVNCSATNLCVAVDRFGKGFITTNPTAAHPTWKAATIDSDPSAGDTVFGGVSCVGTSLCVAVGYTAPGGFTHERVAITTNPTAATPTWTAADAVDFNSVVGGGPNAVSCPTTAFCLMVDDHGRALVSKDPTAASPTWTPTEVDGIQPQSAVACVSASFCVSTESATGKVAISKDPGAASPTWTLAQIDGFNPLNAVSCPSVSFCAAVDVQGNVLTSANPGAAAPVWKSLRIDDQAPLIAVSCPSQSFCAAVDQGGNVVVSTNPAAASPAWTLTHADASPFDGVSCVSASLCVAVDRSGFAVTSTDPAGENPGWFLTPINASGYVGGVSCPSAALCVAVDAGHALVSANPAADFPDWTTTNVYASGGFNDPSMYAVSCPTTNLCVAGNLPGQLWVSTNPGAEDATWTAPAGLGGQTTGISCPTVSFCVAVSGYGGRLVSTDPADPQPTWTETDIDTPYFINAVSCASPALCVAVDGAGQIMTGSYTGTPPTPPVASAPPTISGTTTNGSQLDAAHGTWSGDPTSYDDQWQRCNASGSACVPVAGATALTYQLGDDDVGHTLRLQETAHGPGGTSAPSTSVATAVITTPAPELIAAPAILGATTVGELLTVGHGIWSGSPTSYADQWQRCDASGSACVAISGATGATYRLVAADVGHTLRVRETAHGAGGDSAPATTEPTAVVKPLPPVTSGPPAISGITTAGHTLTATHGTWTGSPTSYEEQWQRCDSAGSACTPFGATGLAYGLTDDDVGHTLRVQVTATNAGGSSDPATSAATAVVKAAPVPPVSSAPPAITGAATAGQLLTASHGTWSNDPTSYTDTWMRCTNTGTGCSPIASGETYRLTSSDVGHTLRVAETATGPGGTGAPATSAATAVVQAVPPGGGGGGGGTPPGGNPAPPPKIARATTSGAVVRVTITCATACTVTLTITVTVTLRRGKVIAVSTRKRKVMIGKATATLAAGQERSVRVTLNKAGRKLLAGRKRFKARLTVGRHGGPVSRATLTFRRKQHI